MTTTFIILAYLIGSLSSAIILSKLRKQPDPRTFGSKNAGATNILRGGDKTLAALVLVGDALKGFIIVILARLLSVTGMGLGLVALAAVIGHIFPAYFHFKGGKGVATSFGGILALSWPIAIVCLVIWGILVAIYRYSSFASLVASAAAPLLSLVFMPSYFIPLVAMTGLLVWKHWDNIEHLKAGTEPKIVWEKDKTSET